MDSSPEKLSQSFYTFYRSFSNIHFSLAVRENHLHQALGLGSKGRCRPEHDARSGVISTCNAASSPREPCVR